MSTAMPYIPLVESSIHKPRDRIWGPDLTAASPWPQASLNVDPRDFGLPRTMPNGDVFARDFAFQAKTPPSISPGAIGEGRTKNAADDIVGLRAHGRVAGLNTRHSNQNSSFSVSGVFK